jgi:hypothetical protein
VAGVPFAGGWAAVAADSTGHLWPFAAPLDGPDLPNDLLRRWSADWAALTGAPAELPPMTERPPALAAAVGQLSGASVGNPEADVTLALVAQAAVRAWARWLPRLGGSGTPFLLAHLVRRPGRVSRDAGGLLVELEPRPLDAVLRACGYLDPIEPPPGSTGPVIRFRVAGVG